MQRLMAVLFVAVMFASTAQASETYVTLAPEVGLEGIAKSFNYTKEQARGNGLQSSGIEYSSVPVGLTLTIARKHFSVIAEFSASSIHSTNEFRTADHVTVTDPVIREANGSALNGQLTGQYQATHWLDLAAGIEQTRFNDHLGTDVIADTGYNVRTVPTRTAFTNTYTAPLIRVGLHHKVRRAVLAVGGTWYPWVNRSQAYEFTFDSVPSPTMKASVSGHGFAVRAGISILISKNSTLTAAWRYQRFQDRGTTLFGGDWRVPESRSSNRVTVGFSVRP